MLKNNKRALNKMSFQTKFIFILLISLSLLLVTGISGCPAQEAQPEIKNEEAMGGTLSGNTHEVAITSQGFSPNSLTINAGDTVIWINQNTNEHWPASAMHPTHTVYPGSGLHKCGTEEEEGIFDACRGLATGETFEFTFNEPGTWRYHDHLQVSFTGTINVN